MTLPPLATELPVAIWRHGAIPAVRCLPEETAVALTYDHVTFAVMIVSPADLEDFAIGFSLSEAIIERPAEITSFEIMPLPAGVECRMSLAPDRRLALDTRRRYVAGPAGCGLCGMDSLTQALRPSKRVAGGLTISPNQILAAMARLPDLQHLNRQTRGTHAAAFYQPASGALLLREDVGRHNALDKLIGALHRRGDNPASGAVLLTSRVSIELIQKIATYGASIVVAVSVPSALAVREADAAGITLVAVARGDGFEVFTHPRGVSGL